MRGRVWLADVVRAARPPAKGHTILYDQYTSRVRQVNFGCTQPAAPPPRLQPDSHHRRHMSR
jgi:hypothetical protein